jgi:large subunit ribosomal protein L10
LVREDKITKVEDIKRIFESGHGIIFTDHTGLKAEDSFQIRNRLAEIESYIKILKNTLALLAAKQVYQDINFSEVFKGPTSVIVTSESIITAAKLAKGFVKDYEAFKIKAGLFEGELLSADDVERLASLPSKGVLIAHLLRIMQNPFVRLITVLGSTTRNLIIVLDVIKKQKKQGTN